MNTITVEQVLERLRLAIDDAKRPSKEPLRLKMLVPRCPCCGEVNWREWS